MLVLKLNSKCVEAVRSELLYKCTNFLCFMTMPMLYFTFVVTGRLFGEASDRRVFLLCSSISRDRIMRT